MLTALIDKLDKWVVADAETGDSQRRATSRRGLRGLDIRHRVRLWQRQDHVSAKPPGVAGAGLERCFWLWPLSPLSSRRLHPAQEYDPPIRTLAKNTDQSSDRAVLLNASQDGLNQAFRTGPNLGGYELTSIVLHVHDTHESRYMTIDAGIYLWDDGSGFTRVAKLTRGQLNDYRGQ